MNIEKLAWDSDFFGYPIGKYVFQSTDHLYMQLPTLLQTAQAIGLRLLYVFTPVQTRVIETMEALGGLWIDHKVYFYHPLHTQQESLQTTHLSHEITKYSSTFPTPALEALALECGAHSRFRIDPHFPKEAFERLYKHWLLQSIQSSKMHLWISGSPHQPLGFVATRLSPPTIYIELIAVKGSQRGKGVGHSLVQQVIYFALKNGCNSLRLNTQERNQQAMYFFKEKERFQIEKEHYVFHFWLLPTSQ